MRKELHHKDMVRIARHRFPQVSLAPLPYTRFTCAVNQPVPHVRFRRLCRTLTLKNEKRHVMTMSMLHMHAIRSTRAFAAVSRATGLSPLCQGTLGAINKDWLSAPQLREDSQPPNPLLIQWSPPKGLPVSRLPVGLW